MKIYNYKRVVKRYRRAYRSQGYSLRELAMYTDAPVRTLKVMLKGILRNDEDETIKNARDLDEDGFTEAEIAGAVGIGQSSVSKILRMPVKSGERQAHQLTDEKIDKFYISAHTGKRKIPLPNYQKVVAQYRDLYEKGMSIRELHEKTGTPVRTLQRMMEPLARKKKATLAKKVLGLRREGKIQTEIAKEAGISQGEVSNVLRELREGLDDLNFRCYAEILDPDIYGSHAQPGDDGGADEGTMRRMEQLKALSKVNERNYSEVVPRWESLAHALRYVYERKYKLSGLDTPEEYFERKLDIPIDPVKVLVEAYKKIDQGSVILTLPLVEVNDLIDEYYAQGKRKSAAGIGKRKQK